MTIRAQPILRFALTTSLAASTAIAAAEPVPSVAATRLTGSGKWVVEYADRQCVLNRELSGPAQGGYLSLSPESLNSLVWLRVATPSGTVANETGDAIMSIDGRQLSGKIPFRIFRTKEFQIREFLLDATAHPLASMSGAIRFWTERHGDIELTFDGFGTAWSAMEKCAANLLSELRIDEAIMARMAVAPLGRSLSFVDRPPLPTGKTLQFSVLYWVDLEGRVGDCRVLKPSGQWKFDRTFCKQLQRRGRFTPGRDRAGLPMSAPRLDSITLHGPRSASGTPSQISVRH